MTFVTCLCLIVIVVLIVIVICCLIHLEVSEEDKKTINKLKKDLEENRKWSDITFGYERVIIEKIKPGGKVMTTVINRGDI